MDDLEKSILENAAKVRAEPSSFASAHSLKLHSLAEKQSPEAMKFFVECFDDERWDWREMGILQIAYHYYDYIPPEVFDRIRQILVQDPNEEVRIAASIFLGNQSNQPEPALKVALSDEVEDVRSKALTDSCHILYRISAEDDWLAMKDYTDEEFKRYIQDNW